MPSHVSEIISSSTEFRDALMLRHTRHLRIYQFLATVEASTRSSMWFMPLIVNRMLCHLVRAWYHDVLRYRAHVSSPSRIWCEPMINPTPMHGDGKILFHPTFWMPIAVICWLPAFGWDRLILILLLLFALRILVERLKGTCNPRSLNMTYPTRLNATLKASW